MWFILYMIFPSRTLHLKHKGKCTCTSYDVLTLTEEVNCKINDRFVCSIHKKTNRDLEASFRIKVLKLKFSISFVKTCIVIS